jgi:hypothetical protein
MNGNRLLHNMSNRKVAIMLNFVEIQIDFCCLEVMGPYAEPGE